MADPPRRPWAETLEQLTGINPDELQGRDRLGALSFDEAPAQLEAILEIVRDLELEDLERLDPNFLAGVHQQLKAVQQTVGQMLGLASSSANAAQTATQLRQNLQTHYNWFVQQVRPFTLRAQVRRAVADAAAPEQDVMGALAEARKRLDELQQREVALRGELEKRADLVEAQRAAAGASGAAELSAEYAQRAREHGASWRRWLKILGLALGVAVIGGLALLLIGRPGANASTPEVASYIARNVLVIGLLLYAVRLASLQFRVHRHLEAVAHDKTAALSTFSRLVTVASEPEIRGSLAAALAQSVFATGDSGFIDASSDHVTLVERAAAPVVQRLAPQ